MRHPPPQTAAFGDLANKRPRTASLWHTRPPPLLRLCAAPDPSVAPVPLAPPPSASELLDAALLDDNALLDELELDADLDFPSTEDDDAAGATPTADAAVPPEPEPEHVPPEPEPEHVPPEPEPEHVPAPEPELVPRPTAAPTVLVRVDKVANLDFQIRAWKQKLGEKTYELNQARAETCQLRSALALDVTGRLTGQS
jgi:hypothetical protein